MNILSNPKKLAVISSLPEDNSIRSTECMKDKIQRIITYTDAKVQCYRTVLSEDERLALHQWEASDNFTGTDEWPEWSQPWTPVSDRARVAECCRCSSRFPAVIASSKRGLYGLDRQKVRDVPSTSEAVRRVSRK